MAEKTRAQLAEENEELRTQLADLQANLTAASRPVPMLPSYGLSEGTRLDILEAQQKIQQNARIKAVELVEPFTGRVIHVTADHYTLPDETTETDPEVDLTPTPDA